MRKHYRTIAAASALLITAGVLMSAATAAVKGDLNNDGRLSRDDAISLRSFLTGVSNELKEDMDFNGDQKVNAKDLSAMKYSILNPQQQQNPEDNPGQQSGPQDTPSGIKDYGTPMNENATMVSDFRKGAGDFFASEGWTNGKPFDCWWYKQNAQIQNSALELKIDQKWNPSDRNDDWNPQYSGGEFRTNNFYHYGYYECSMQAIKNDGVVSSFFTYTGPSDVINGQKNPWDEVDIEILGKDTTKMQLNYYRDGVGKHEYMYDLGFDASEGYHTYGFDWQSDHITWYVDGKEAYTMRGDCPKTASKIMMNAWPGLTVDDWLKPYNGNKPLVAHYQWVTYDEKGKSSSGQQGQQGGQQQNPWEQQGGQQQNPWEQQGGQQQNPWEQQGGQQQNPWEQQGQQGQQGQEQQGQQGQEQQNYGGMNKNATMVSDFTTGNAGDFFASEGWTNGKPFDCWWYKQNAQIVNGLLELKIDQKWNPSDRNDDWNPQYSGGEFRTNNFYHYGYYECSMKAIKNDGVVSSFFTYTGPSDVVNGQKNPWDEVDVEILGKDTTKVQFNYYRDGVGKHEYMYDLGFDSSQDFHRYGFDWQSDHITWYVDGKEAYTMRGDCPKTPSKIMMNAWPGLTVDDWLKPYNGNKPLTAYYQWVTYNQQ